MKRFYLFLAMAGILQTGFGQTKDKDINIPDLDNYKTLKCDFHIHTVFSDGLVWPTVRVDEAYSEGLDAISLTEHIEYRPHKDDIKADHNRSYEIIKQYAKDKEHGNRHGVWCAVPRRGRDNQVRPQRCSEGWRVRRRRQPGLPLLRQL